MTQFSVGMNILCQSCSGHFIHLILLNRLALLAFHNALVNSPQDAQVIKAFAALMHFGTWDSAIEFLNEDVGAPVTYVPEALGPSGAKVDNLMEQTSHLASLVKSSVDTLTCLNTLKQSVVRYPGASQFSGLVSTALAYPNSQPCIFTPAVLTFLLNFLFSCGSNLCYFPVSRLNQ